MAFPCGSARFVSSPRCPGFTVAEQPWAKPDFMRTITGWVGDIGRMMELELAFKYPAGRRLDVDRLVRARGGAGRAIRRDTVYFDTPDCALASSGFSLGVRRVGRFRVQTLISLGQTGIGATPRDRSSAFILPVMAPDLRSSYVERWK